MSTTNYNETGVALAKLGRFEEAAQQFELAVAANQELARSYNNLGSMRRECGRLEDAIAAFRRALAGEWTGELTTPEAVRAWFGNLGPIAREHEYIFLNLIRTTLDFIEVEDWSEIIAAALREPALSVRSRFMLLVSRAISDWACGNLGELDRALTDAAEAWRIGFPIGEQEKRRMAGLNGYTEYLALLAAFRRARGELYQPNCGSAFPIVGDSHCLSYTGLPARLGNSVLRIRGIVVPGCRGWDLIRQPNATGASFLQRLAALPAGSLAGISFGEIDCRPAQGILSEFRRCGGDLASLTESQARAAVHMTASAAAKDRLALWFLTVPPPHPALRTQPEGGTLAELIRQYNHAICAAAQAVGHRTIDVYSEAVGPDGFAMPDKHLDHAHLVPHPLRLS